MADKEDLQKKFEELIEEEERKLRGLKKVENQTRQETPDGQPIEGRIKATEESVRNSIRRINIRQHKDSIENILKSQNLSPKYIERDLSSAGKRSKRYYIRKRIEQNKPYIPQAVRILGKKEARRLGYKVWEVRRRESEMDSEEEEERKEIESIDKLRTIFRMLGDRIGRYLYENRKDSGDNR